VIKLEQKGFTMVELLISIGILGIMAPLLAFALFQILTFTERGRAGFEAQADTRNASTWMSQDIMMAQGTDLVVGTPIGDPDCGTPVGFTWTDYFDDRNTNHEVTYCLDGNDLKRTYDDAELVIARNIASVTFEATAEREISVTISSAPENRFGVFDEKTFKVLMRSTA